MHSNDKRAPQTTNFTKFEVIVEKHTAIYMKITVNITNTEMQENRLFKYELYKFKVFTSRSTATVILG